MSWEVAFDGVFKLIIFQCFFAKGTIENVGISYLLLHFNVSVAFV